MKELLFRSTLLLSPLSRAFILEHLLLGNAHGQPRLTAGVTCQPPDDGQPSRT